MNQDQRSIFEHLRAEAGFGGDGHLIVVSIPAQQLLLFSRGNLLAAYPVSTARKGCGNKNGSEMTPLGIHRIAEKIGADCEAGTVFRSRRPTGERLDNFHDASGDTDMITSRILWLDGQEEGVNRGGEVDSKRRYIYIHGTQAEDEIGQPVSHGCVRMKNADVIDLFDRVAVDDLVYITEARLDRESAGGAG